MAPQVHQGMLQRYLSQSQRNLTWVPPPVKLAQQASPLQPRFQHLFDSHDSIHAVFPRHPPHEGWTLSVGTAAHHQNCRLLTLPACATAILISLLSHSGGPDGCCWHWSKTCVKPLTYMPLHQLWHCENVLMSRLWPWLRWKQSCHATLGAPQGRPEPVHILGGEVSGQGGCVSCLCGYSWGFLHWQSMSVELISQMAKIASTAALLHLNSPCAYSQADLKRAQSFPIHIESLCSRSE